jgi:hypothetical protein
MQIFQSLIEIQRDISSISAKTERLVDDVNKLDGKVSGIETALALAKGFGIAAIILIPICAAIIWWLIGAKLENLRDQLLSVARPPPIHQVSPILPGPPSTPATHQ